MSETTNLDGLGRITPPLGLPTGSVRALLTLGILGTVWAQLLRGLATGQVLHDTLLLVLGYYFGHRAATAPAADKLAAPADREDNPKDPLYLPRGSIRVIIMLGFGLVAWRLYQTQKLGPGGVPPILILVGTFLGASILKGVLGLAAKGLGNWLLSMIGHFVAAVTVLIVGSYCAAVILVLEDRLPHGFESTFLGIVGFYFGKR